MQVLKFNKEIRYKKCLRKAETDKACEIYNKIYNNFDENIFIKIFNKSTNEQYFYNSNAIKNKDKLFQLLKRFGNTDLYISLNQFNTMKSSKKKYIFCITTIAIDIDYKNIKEFKELPASNIIELLKLDHLGYDVPYPNYFEFGNQLRLIYIINPVYIPKTRKNAIRLADKISHNFAEILKEYGAEAQGVESYMRVPGSINSKNNSIVEIIDNNIEPYTLRFLQDGYLPELPKGYKNKIDKPNMKVHNLHNVNTLNLNRLIDLDKIQTDLNRNYETDKRKRLVFFKMNFELLAIKKRIGTLTIDDYDSVLSETSKYNEKFLKPLTATEFRSATTNRDLKTYVYKSKTLLNELELTTDDVKILDLKSFNSLIKDSKDYYEENKENILKNKNKYYKNNKEIKQELNKNYYKENKEVLKEKAKEQYQKKLKENGEVKKMSKIEIRRKKIIDLLQQGLSTQDICNELKISYRTYLRDSKHIL